MQTTTFGFKSRGKSPGVAHRDGRSLRLQPSLKLAGEKDVGAGDPGKGLLWRNGSAFEQIHA